MMNLNLVLFGSLQLEIDNQPVTVSLWAKTRALLAYLAVEANRPHRREYLAGLLWPEQPEEQARNSLRQALHQLGKAIPAQYIQRTAQTVQFNTTDHVCLDIADFSARLQACNRHNHRQRFTCVKCLDNLQQAVNLYQDDFLSQLFLKDAISFEEWALLQREQLRRRALSALRDLTEAHARRGDFRLMEETAHRQLELEPFDEVACRAVMQSLVWQGRRTAALAHFRGFCRLLHTELSTPPEPATMVLAQQIQAGDSVAPVSPPCYNWPHQLTSFVGRADEISSLLEMLQTPHTRLVTITGTGGVGKTRLALQVAQAARFAFEDGVCFVPLAGISDPKYILPALAEAVSLTLVKENDPNVQLLNYLRSREMLLLLDNFEHILPAATLVGDILAAAPNVVVLVTSCMLLNLYGEQEFPLRPFPSRSTTAANLLVARTQAARPTFRRTSENGAQIDEICAQLDGLPLAIELAAPHLKHLSLAALSDQLQHRLNILDDGPINLPARHRTLLAAITWSFNLLSATAQRCFTAMGVFAGGFDESAALAVFPQNRLADLLSANLVQLSFHQSQETRFVMLETIREYALERLRQSGEAHTVYRSHAEYYTSLAQQADEAWTSTSQPEWQRRLQDDLDNIRAALEWCRHNDPQLGLKLALGMYQAWYLWGTYAEGESWFREMLSQASQPSVERAKGLYSLALLLQRRQKFAPARPFLAESIAYFRTSGDFFWVAATLMRQADDLMFQHNFVQAEMLAREAVELFEDYGSRREVSWALGTVAMCLHNRGEFAEAKSAMIACINAGRQAEDKRHLAWMLVIGAEMALDFEDWLFARACLDEAQPAFEAVNDRPGMVYLQLQCGWFAFLRGKKSLAQDILSETLPLAFETLTYKARLLALLAIIFFARQEASACIFGVKLWAAALAHLPGVQQQLLSQQRDLITNGLEAVRTVLDEVPFARIWAEGEHLSLEEITHHLTRV